MANSTKFSLFIALSFLGIWTCKHLQPKKPVDEIIVANDKVTETVTNRLINIDFTNVEVISATDT